MDKNTFYNFMYFLPVYIAGIIAIIANIYYFGVYALQLFLIIGIISLFFWLWGRYWLNKKYEKHEENKSY